MFFCSRNKRIHGITQDEKVILFSDELG